MWSQKIKGRDRNRQWIVSIGQGICIHISSLIVKIPDSHRPFNIMGYFIGSIRQNERGGSRIYEEDRYIRFGNGRGRVVTG
jgi:hypothetical protein